jgi:hypothetical protein
LARGAQNRYDGASGDQAAKQWRQVTRVEFPAKEALGIGDPPKGAIAAGQWHLLHATQSPVNARAPCGCVQLS